MCKSLEYVEATSNKQFALYKPSLSLKVDVNFLEALRYETTFFIYI